MSEVAESERVDSGTTGAETADTGTSGSEQASADAALRSSPRVMHRAEAATSLTDGVLALVAFLLAWRVHRRLAQIDWSGEPFAAIGLDPDIRLILRSVVDSHFRGTEIMILDTVARAFVELWLVLWMIAFVAIGIAALTGAVEHAISPADTARRSAAARFIAVVLSLASSAIFAAVSAQAIANLGDYWSVIIASPLLFVVILFGMLKVVGFMIYASRREVPSFTVSIIDFGAVLALVAAAHRLSIAPLGIEGAPGAPWLLGGVVASAFAGIVQLRRIAPHPAFDHNALFHVLMIPALWLLSEGAIRAVGAF